jgi:imidazolonepropionase-like amidohydrolase
MDVLFSGGMLWDARAAGARPGELRVSGQRIVAVAHDGARLPREGAMVVNAADATLIPGLADVHSHVSFPPAFYPNQIEDTPPEETLMATVHNARLLLDSGFTLLIGAGAPRFRSEIVVRNEIEAGRLPGPRLLASTPTLTATGGLNDQRQLFHPRPVAALIVDGAEEARKAVRLGYREGADVVKLNISGDGFFPRPPGRITVMEEDEVAAAARTAHRLGMRLSAHARSAESIKLALRHRVQLINHADYADAEALDMLEAARDRVVVAPTIGYLHALMQESEACGVSPQMRTRMQLEEHLASNVATHRELLRRGLRLAIGGDYGLPWQSHGANARDIQLMVRYYGCSAAQALACATLHGAAAAGREHELGLIEPGYLADLLLVRGDPLADPALLQDRGRLLAIMKDGQFHKPPAGAAAQA